METKCYCGHTTRCDCGPESLEEFAERFTPQSDKWTIKEIFIEGAKWQQERSYSEEEVGEIIYKAFGECGKHYSLMLDGAFIDRLFKQFKKK